MTYQKREYIQAFTFTALCFLIALACAFLASCTLEEWRDIGNDAVATAPGAASDVFIETDPSTGDTKFVQPTTERGVDAGIGFVTGLAAGWYSRKFREKKYAQKAVGDDTGGKSGGTSKDAG